MLQRTIKTVLFAKLIIKPFGVIILLAINIFTLNCLSWIFFVTQKIIDFLISMAIYFMLAYCKLYIFLTLIFNFLLSIIALVDKTILLIADVLSLAVFCIFIICTNRNLISSSFLMLYLRWLYKCLRFSKQT